MLREILPNATIFNNYGCAEALPRLTLRRAEDAASAADIGQPIPGVALKTSETGGLLFLSEYGCVAQVSLHGFQPVAEDEWIPSGDLARAGDNRHWHLLGRAGEVFKRYGEKIAIPQILSTVNEQWEGQVSYYREQDGAGEDGYVLVLCPPPTTEALHKLLQAFRSKHPRTHWPLRIESLVAFPLLHNGKVNTLAVQKGENKTLHWRQRI
jgi:acyl-CoA synthetase (AMP-forming)/AMP-acid ligase II